MKYTIVDVLNFQNNGENDGYFIHTPLRAVCFLLYEYAL